MKAYTDKYEEGTKLREAYQGHPMFKKLTEDELALHSAKNSDYAKGGDPLGNFKRVGNILGQYPKLDLNDPTVVALTYMMKQLDAALWMLAKGYEGNVENIDTRLQDVHVYAKLARILHKEKQDGISKAQQLAKVPTVALPPPKV